MAGLRFAMSVQSMPATEELKIDPAVVKSIGDCSQALESFGSLVPSLKADQDSDIISMVAAPTAATMLMISLS
eukprot:5123600-Alexandrium_andersonii.AAC.1